MYHSSKYFSGKTAILFHLYYHDLFEEISIKIQSLPFEYDLYINMVETNNNIDYMKEVILNKFPFAHIIISPNMGMDIGGQLRLMDILIKKEQKHDYLIFLQTKKSAHDIEGGTVWRNELLSIISPDKIDDIMYKFLDPKIGMIGTNKWNINNHNSPYGMPIDFCSYYCDKFNLKNMHTKSFGFIGGTMFWVRANIYFDFFKNNPPLEIVNELETYSTGGKIHALERILGYIILDKGYTIGGI